MKNYFSHAGSGLSYAILLGGFITIGVAAFLVVISYSSLPFSDGWTPVAAAASGVHLLSFDWLVRQHNTHRLVIPKLLLIADLRLFQYRQVFLLASIFVIQLLHWLLPGWSMKVLGGWRGAVWRSGVGVSAFCLFCPSQWENFVWGFQVCFTSGLVRHSLICRAAALLDWAAADIWDLAQVEVPRAFYPGGSGRQLFTCQRKSSLAFARGCRNVTTASLTGSIELRCRWNSKHGALLSWPLSSAATC